MLVKAARRQTVAEPMEGLLRSRTAHPREACDVGEAISSTQDLQRPQHLNTASENAKLHLYQNGIYVVKQLVRVYEVTVVSWQTRESQNNFQPSETYTPLCFVYQVYILLSDVANSSVAMADGDEVRRAGENSLSILHIHTWYKTTHVHRPLLSKFACSCCSRYLPSSSVLSPTDSTNIKSHTYRLMYG